MERLTLTWTRPDGQKAVAVEFTYATTEKVSDTLADLLDVLEGVRRGAQTQRQAIEKVSDTLADLLNAIAAD